ncbi:MAG: hypothetical protein JXR25_14105 [Pontiellaceae bacterium]|nr:hypothetical protein [Pontiellaceae bacterium]MBN2785952.1 hypothetical protein [Pontiellaceae bacterium]
MKKLLITLSVLLIGVRVLAGAVGLPKERIALPAVSGSHLVCIWDETANAWLQDFEAYDHAGSYSFQLPSWGQWYWIGLWDEDQGAYVFGKWIGHFIAE